MELLGKLQLLKKKVQAKCHWKNSTNYLKLQREREVKILANDLSITVGWEILSSVHPMDHSSTRANYTILKIYLNEQTIIELAMISFFCISNSQ
jgi:hypothetical protein